MIAKRAPIALSSTGVVRKGQVLDEMYRLLQHDHLFSRSDY
jgi:hypothetical protein